MDRFYLYVAVPASIILVIQTIMTFLGMSGDIDVDFDGDGDVDIEGGSSVTLFSVRNLVAFFTFFGWSGLWMLESGFSPLIVAIISVLIGAIFVAISMGLFYLVSKLQRSGSLRIQNTIGLVGEVYIPIPPNREKSGKIMMSVQGALMELEAYTDDIEILRSGTQVEVVGIIGTSKLLVTKHKI
ncbi:MAG: NfeD family protein [Bacillota bacterium]|nr:NfeD family protein [Bacillota bacterium]